MEIVNHIVEILRHSIITVMSWGFHNPVAIENGIRFNVQGFIFTGKVEVTYDYGYDLFTVKLLNTDGTTKEVRDGIYVDGLIDTIDRLVEYCPNYGPRVRETYCI